MVNNKPVSKTRPKVLTWEFISPADSVSGKNKVVTSQYEES